MKKEPKPVAYLTIEAARTKTINFIANSTQCCFQNYPNPNCTLHTPAWVEQEAKARFDTFMESQRWTSRLGDLSDRFTPKRLGQILVELGYREWRTPKKQTRMSFNTWRRWSMAGIPLDGDPTFKPVDDRPVADLIMTQTFIDKYLPTKKALDEGVAKYEATRGHDTVLWHREKMTNVLSGIEG